MILFMDPFVRTCNWPYTFTCVTAAASGTKYSGEVTTSIQVVTC